MKHLKILLAALLSITIMPAYSQAQDLAVKAKTIFTSGKEGIITNGIIIIKDGKISKVGKQGSIKIPKGMKTIEAAVVTPGLIDSHSVVGVNGAYNVPQDQDSFESSDATGAQFHILDSYNAHEILVEYVKRFGVTTLHVTPGVFAPIAGQTALFKTTGNGADDDVVRGNVAMLFNLGERPKQAFGSNGGPRSRMGVAAKIREELLKAQDWASKEEKDRSSDLAMVALAKVLSGEMNAIFTAHRADDIATALRIAKEFNIKPIINYGTEAYLMTDDLKQAGATVISAPTSQRDGAQEMHNTTLESAAILEKTGVPHVFATGYEGYVPKSRVLLWEMAFAVGNGLDAEEAVKAATIDPAKLWGIDDKVGSLEKGKEADFVLYDTDPFEYTSHVIGVYIKGTKVSDGE